MSIYAHLYPHLNIVRASVPSKNFLEKSSNKKEEIKQEQQIESKTELKQELKVKVKKEPKIVEVSETESEPTPIIKVPKKTRRQTVPSKPLSDKGYQGGISPEPLEEEPKNEEAIIDIKDSFTKKPTGKKVAKYSEEERKQMYLNKLARKSVKKADAEMEEITKILDNCDRDKSKLEEEKKELKRKLKLINTAKYFNDN